MVGRFAANAVDEGFGTDEGLVNGGGWWGEGCAGRRLLPLAAISRQRPYLSLLATALDDCVLQKHQDRLWLQKQLQRTASGNTSTHTPHNALRRG